MKSNHISNNIYTPELIAFAQVGVEFASLLEQGAERTIYIEHLLKILPQLYGLMLRLPSYFFSPEEDILEEYINEASYERVRIKSEEILGADDMYLSTASNEMQYSDTPLAVHISEQLADIYQHVGNLLGIIKEQNEVALPSAIGRCRLYWQEHWGLALISALGALHQIYAQLSPNDAFEQDEEDMYNYDDDDEA